MIQTIEKTDMMLPVDIRNEELLEILNGEMLEFIQSVPVETGELCEQRYLDQREEYCSDEYFNHIKKMWDAHNGFPEQLCGVAFDDVKTGAH